MALDLYSKGSVDTLLAAKLSISSLSNGAATNIDATAPTNGQVLGYSDATSSLVWLSASGGGLTINDLSNGATSTLNATAPTTGQALTFDGTDLVWATVGGGSYLPLAGGAMDTSAVITIANGTTDSYAGADLLGVELTSDSTQNATLQYDGVRVANGSGTTYVGPTGITFPDSTVQTTAAVAGANLGDVFAMSIVKDVTWTGSGWQLTCEPVNSFLYSAGGMAVVNSSISAFEWMSGMSTTSTWTYTTTTFGSGDYVYIQCLSQVSTQPVNNI